METLWVFLVSCCLVGVSSRNIKERSTVDEKPNVYMMHINSNIKYRYAETLISSRVVNPASTAQEYLFRITIPDAAFITGFVMTIKEKDYRAYVKEKEEAKKVYDQAVSMGQSAAHVAYNPRDSNEFQVSMNIEPQGKVFFNLTYEDFLSRQLGSYEHKINIDPGQIVKDLKVTVNIEDTSPIINLKVPSLKMTNEISKDYETNELAKIENETPEKVKITWAPTPEEQRELKEEGVSGQFIVKFDVDRSKSPQQILVNDGYFVHFFSNDKLPSLNKYVVFVLDLSGSMAGRKMEQLKSAMNKILSDLKKTDYFSIVVFSNEADVWAPNKNMTLDSYYYFNPGQESRRSEPTPDNIISATEENIKKATEFVKTITDLGGTNIIAGLRLGVKLIKMGNVIFNDLQTEGSKPQPIVVFLTDGEPNVEESDPKKITEKITELNTQKNPIFSLGFGYEADIHFLRNLSLANNAFARSIYEASDAALQLEEFFQTISSPLLSNVKFEYLPGQVSNDSTKSSFYNLFSGGELVVIGKLSDSENKTPLEGKLVANGLSGMQEFTLPPVIIIDHIPIPPKSDQNKTYGPLEKMWAYKSIKQLIDDNELTQNKESKKKALDLALQYSFVTPLTSLVVVKPDEKSVPFEDKKVETQKFPFGPNMGVPMQQLYAFPAAPIAGFSASRQPVMQSGTAGAAGNFAFGAPPNIGTGFAGIGLSAPVKSSLASIPGSFMLNSAGMPDSFMLNSADIPDMQQVASMPTTTYGDRTTTFKIPSAVHVKIDYQDVNWLGNETIERDNETYIKPPSSLSDQHLIALNKTAEEHSPCTAMGENGHCVHFIFCTLQEFSNSIDLYNVEFKCLVGTEYLGVCCPDSILHSGTHIKRRR